MSTQSISKENRAETLEQLSDILLVLDKKKNKIEAVKGLDEEGNLKTGEPKKSSLGDFLRVDKSDLVGNFFSNFWRRLKDPVSFRFFRTPAIDMHEIARKLQAAIDHPTPEGNKLLDTLEVKYDNKLKQNMDTNQTTEEKKANKFNVGDIDWSSLEKLNLNRELLEKNGQLDKLLKGYKTDGVYRLEGNFDGIVMKGDARLALRNVQGKVVVMAHGVRVEPDLKSQFYGHSFTTEDKENLLKTGNMGRVAELTNYQDGTKVKALISIDRQTNEVISFPVDLIKISDKFGGVKISSEQKAELLEGKQVLIEGMKNTKTGDTFSQHLQYSADEKKLVFVGHSEANKQSQSEGIPNEFRGKTFTEQDKKLLEEGEVVKLKDIVNKSETGLYSGYVWVNKQTGKLEFDFKDPKSKESLQNAEKQNQGAAQNISKENKPKKESTRKVGQH